jgi:hypothetical protein
MHRHLIAKIVGAVVLLTALGGGAASAFTASNTVGASNAGEGSAAVSGYTVYNIEYAGVTGVGDPTYNPTGNGPSQTGSMVYLNGPVVGGLSEQDGVQYVAFQLSPDNAHWAAVQVYNAAGVVTGGGGASSCSEHATPTSTPGFYDPAFGEGTFNSASGIWICDIHATAEGAGGPGGAGGAVPVSDISYIDVEAAQ